MGLIHVGMVRRGVIAGLIALAALAATMFPSGTLINNNGWNGGCFDCGGGWAKPGIGIPMPMPVEPVPEKGFVVPGQGGLVVVDVGAAGAAEPAVADGVILPER